MDSASRKAILTEIDAMSFKLTQVCESTRDWDAFIKIVENEERQHRKGYSPSQFKINIKHSVRLHATKRILGYAFGLEKTPDPASFFWLRASLYGAYALATDKRDEILAAFTLEQAQQAQAWDYAELAN